MLRELLAHQLKIAQKRYFQGSEATWTDLTERVFNTVMVQELDELKAIKSTVGEAGHVAIERDVMRGEELANILGTARMLLDERKFLFNTPTWINAGMPGARTLSACFVGELHDDMLGKGGILDASYWFGAVQKFGGGTGIDLSEIRPKGEPIKSTHGKACGPLMVLKYLASTSQMITQGGARDGANMAVMSVYHKDITEFVGCKQKEAKYLLELPLQVAQQHVDAGLWKMEEGQDYIEYCRKTGVYQLFNVSVAVDAKFMRAIGDYMREDIEDPFDSKWQGSSWREMLPCGLAIYELWELIVDMAWSSGDPGLLFMERAQEFARFHSIYIPHATNPCGEQFLPEHGSCNLGSIDLAKYVDDNWGSEGWYERVSWTTLAHDIKICVRMLDNVVEINKHPVKEIEERNNQERRIGLGVMGWADVLFKLRIPYDSDLALEVAEVFAKFFKEHAHQASVDLAGERGAFPLFAEVNDATRERPLDLTKIDLDDVAEPVMPKRPRRNATVTTVAPTGTISLMAGCSSGIEPHFMLGYEHQGLKEHGGLGYIWASDTLRLLYLSNEGVTKGEWGCPEEFETHIREWAGWAPANEIPIGYHIKHQAVWQKYVDNSISKTLNLPNNASRDAVAGTYLMSYEAGTKGSTVYRDGCKPFQVLNAPKPKEKEMSKPEPFDELQDQAETWVRDNPSPVNMPSLRTELVQPGERTRRKRDEIAHGVTIKIKTSDGSLYVTINRGVRDEPFEVFATVGKAGAKAAAYTEAIGRLISMALQYNIPLDAIKKELRGIAGGEPYGMGPRRVLSVPDGIAIAIEKFLDYENATDTVEELIEQSPVVHVTQGSLVDACPDCGASLFREEGCSGGKCIACGFAKCQ